MKREFENYIKIIDDKKSYLFDTLFIEVTNCCNYHCRHCYNSSGKVAKMSIEFEHFKTVIEEFAKNGIASVVLSGGEALLHENIWEMIEFLNLHNLEVTLLTNGKLLSKDVISKLIILKVNIQLSLDGANSTTNDYVRQEGSYNDVMNALTELKNQNYMNNVSVNSVITKKSVYEILDIINVCEKFEISTIAFNFLNNIGRAKDSELMPSNEETKQVINIINNYRDSSNIAVKSINITKRCRFCDVDNDIYLNPVVDIYGNVYMCEFLRKEEFVVGNIFKQTLFEILKGDKVKKIMLFINMRKYFISSCRVCPVCSTCAAGCIMQCKNNNYFDPNYCEIIKKNFIDELGV